MKIAFYANELTHKGASGVKNYSLEIINHLLARDGENDYVLYSQKDISEMIVSPLDKVKFVVSQPRRRFWPFTVFACLVRKKPRPDVVFMPIQTFPFCRFCKDKPKTVITVHDVAFLIFPEHFRFLRRQILKFHTKRAIMYSDKVIVPSEATKRDVLRFYSVAEEKVRVVYHGYSRDLLERGKKDDPRVIGLTDSKPYILFVGSVQPRKNIVRLVQAFDMLKDTGKYPDLKLVICGGKGWMYSKIYHKINCSAHRDDIVVVGNAGNDLLASFYADASLFVMPSLYEGFGLPVLEAMSFEVPVVCADNSSLSEIADGAALLTDGYSAEDIFRKIKRVLDDRTLYKNLRRKGVARAKEFSWDKAARETLEILEEVGGK